MLNITQRQESLYNLLIECKNWVSKEYIVVSLPKEYQRFGEYSNDHNSTAYSQIRNDVRALNESSDIEKIIVSSPKGYKIATQEEAKEYIQKRFKRDLRSLKLNYKLVNKCKLNGQINFDLEEYKTYMEE